MDLSPLQGEFTVGINTLLEWEDLPFMPSVMAAHEAELHALREKIWEFTGPVWWSYMMWYSYVPANPHLFPGPNWHWIQDTPQINWRSDPVKWRDRPELLGVTDDFGNIAWSSTAVIAPAIPALIWMGFKEIYLVGVDNTQQGYVHEPYKLRPEGLSDRCNREFANVMEEVDKYGILIRNCSPYSTAPIPYVSLEQAKKANVVEIDGEMVFA